MLEVLRGDRIRFGDNLEKNVNVVRSILERKGSLVGSLMGVSAGQFLILPGCSANLLHIHLPTPCNSFPKF